MRGENEFFPKIQETMSYFSFEALNLAMSKVLPGPEGKKAL